MDSFPRYELKSVLSFKKIRYQQGLSQLNTQPEVLLECFNKLGIFETSTMQNGKSTGVGKNGSGHYRILTNCERKRRKRWLLGLSVKKKKIVVVAPELT